MQFGFTMGGQTALNLCIKADEKGIWKKYGVRIIGVDIDAINITEDREEFKQLMQTIGIGCAPSKTATSYLEGKAIAQDFGFPRHSHLPHLEARVLHLFTKQKILMKC